MFPLELVVYPGERIALHIFEERYQQLIQDCEQDHITFGIPAYFNNEMRYGTEVRLEEVLKRYPSGASDIICSGVSVFELQHFYNTLGIKLYAGADIVHLPNTEDATDYQKAQFFNLAEKLYEQLDIELPSLDPRTFTSYTLAHKIGLTQEEELSLIHI